MSILAFAMHNCTYFFSNPTSLLAGTLVMPKSKEYELLKENRDIVEKAIKIDTEWVAKELNHPDVDVLTDSDYNTVTNAKSLLTEGEKAGLIFKRLLQWVDMDPDALGMFVEILRKKKKFKIVIEKLGGSKLIILCIAVQTFIVLLHVIGELYLRLLFTPSSWYELAIVQIHFF